MRLHMMPWLLLEVVDRQGVREVFSVIAVSVLEYWKLWACSWQYFLNKLHKMVILCAVGTWLCANLNQLRTRYSGVYSQIFCIFRRSAIFGELWAVFGFAETAASRRFEWRTRTLLPSRCVNSSIDRPTGCIGWAYSDVVAPVDDKSPTTTTST